MKSKLDVAHEYAMLHMMQERYKDADDMEIVAWAYDYADLLFAEQEKRDKQEQQEKLKAFKEIKKQLLNSDNTFVEYEGKHFDDFNSEECVEADFQPDWSVAPEWANWWAKDLDSAYWYEYLPIIGNSSWEVDVGRCRHAQSFNYDGYFKDSLRKRPNY